MVLCFFLALYSESTDVYLTNTLPPYLYPPTYQDTLFFLTFRLLLFCLVALFCFCFLHSLEYIPFGITLCVGLQLVAWLILSFPPFHFLFANFTLPPACSISFPSYFCFSITLRSPCFFCPLFHAEIIFHHFVVHMFVTPRQTSHPSIHPLPYYVLLFCYAVCYSLYVVCFFFFFFFSTSCVLFACRINPIDQSINSSNR